MNHRHLRDIRFRNPNLFFPTELASHERLIRNLADYSLKSEETFELVTDFFSLNPNNRSPEDEWIEDIDSECEYVLETVEDERLKEFIHRIKLILTRLHQLPNNHFRLFRSFFLEKMTLTYLELKYRLSDNEIFHEPKLFVKRKPFFRKRADFREIRVDFAFRLLSLKLLVLCECKANMVQFISRVQEEARSARKLTYMLHVKSSMSTKFSEGTCYPFFTTYVQTEADFVFYGSRSIEVIGIQDLERVIIPH